jgi:UDP-N-acetylmuramate--alanine ligase
VVNVETTEALAPLLAGEIKPGDVVVCMGAGSISQIAADLPAQIAEVVS